MEKNAVSNVLLLFAGSMNGSFARTLYYHFRGAFKPHSISSGRAWASKECAECFRGKRSNRGHNARSSHLDEDSKKGGTRASGMQLLYRGAI